jgi:hypothetical protein
MRVISARGSTQEAAMIDDRDPNSRGPNMPKFGDPDYRDPSMQPPTRPWSDATWAWIAGIAVVVLILAFVVGSRTGPNNASNTATPPSTVGQRTTPPAAPTTPASPSVPGSPSR